MQGGFVPGPGIHGEQRQWPAVSGGCNTIAATTTRTGLRVEAMLDTGSYPTGISITRDQLKALPITPHDRHGRWNYSIAPTGAAAPVPRADDSAAARRQTLTMLADPRLTGMTAGELRELHARLAPAQAARAEQHRYVLRGGRRVATTGRSRALLGDQDEVLITVLYLRQVCPQKVLCDLLGINPVTIGQAIKATDSSWTNSRSRSPPPSCATSPGPRTCVTGSMASPMFRPR